MLVKALQLAAIVAIELTSGRLFGNTIVVSAEQLKNVLERNAKAFMLAGSVTDGKA
jgi:hypothetical protein